MTFFFFLFFQVVMALHLYLLISAYIKFPKKTSLELGFSNLVLPAVTICNVNTFKYSFRYQTPPRMQRFLDKIDPTQYYSQVSMYYSIFIMHKQTSYQAEIYSSMADIHKLRFFQKPWSPRTLVAMQYYYTVMPRSHGSLRLPYCHRTDQNRTGPHGLPKAPQGLFTITTAARALWIARIFD